jgi:hypothetical protein
LLATAQIRIKLIFLAIAPKLLLELIIFIKSPGDAEIGDEIGKLVTRKCDSLPETLRERS